MKVLTVVGARPQFVKAAMVSRAMAAVSTMVEEIIHTGQHYDHGMSAVFFEEMEIPEPVANLGVGSGSHGETTARMLSGIEREIQSRGPDVVLVYGDTNSTLAGALAAAKLHVPVSHVEAGLRSFRRRMPEEINRVVTDHLSERLFCPTLAAVENLQREGITQGVFHVGDVMYDAALHYSSIARDRSSILERLGVKPRGYALVTIHRAENTGDPARLSGILDALALLVRELEVVLPLHPRTRRFLAERGLNPPAEIRVLDPISFLDMVRLEQEAQVILTDSGGVQKEAYFHGVPCVTLRDETEWVETVAQGWNRVVGADPQRILEAVRAARPGRPIAEYGHGDASARIVRLLAQGA